MTALAAAPAKILAFTFERDSIRNPLSATTLSRPSPRPNDFLKRQKRQRTPESLRRDLTTDRSLSRPPNMSECLVLVHNNLDPDPYIKHWWFSGKIGRCHQEIVF